MRRGSGSTDPYRGVSHSGTPQAGSHCDTAPYIIICATIKPFKASLWFLARFHQTHVSIIRLKSKTPAISLAANLHRWPGDNYKWSSELHWMVMILWPRACLGQSIVNLYISICIYKYIYIFMCICMYVCVSKILIQSEWALWTLLHSSTDLIGALLQGATAHYMWPGSQLSKAAEQCCEQPNAFK